MDFWDEQLPQTQDPKRSRGKTPLLLVVALFCVACVAGLLLLWRAPLASFTNAFHPVDIAYQQGGYHYDYILADAAEACGAFCIDADGTIVGFSQASDVKFENAETRFSGRVEAPKAQTRVLAWAFASGKMLVEAPEEGLAPGAAPQATATPALTSAPTAIPGQAIAIEQYAAPNNNVRVVFRAHIAGLNPDMAYMGGFMYSLGQQTLKNVSESLLILGQSEFELTAQLDLPAQLSGLEYQCVFFYYSLAGNGMVISDVCPFTLLPREQLPTFSEAVTPAGIPSPSAVPTPVPTVKPTPIPTIKPTATPRVTATTAATHTPTPAPKKLPTSSQFALYPAETRYYYYQLTEHEKMVFAALYDGVANFEKKVSLQGLQASPKEVENALYVLWYDCPELIQLASEESFSWYGDKQTIVAYDPPYAMTQTEFQYQYSQLLSVLRALAYRSDFGVTQYDHELAIYRYLQENCYYDMDGEHCAYADGPFLYGYAKCTGYAKAFALGCRYYGIPAAVVAGDTIENGVVSPIGHMWNYVCIDGEWYGCDPTWDDPTYDQDAELRDQYLQYFNLTDAEMYTARYATREFVDHLTLPQCTSTKWAFYRTSMPSTIVTGDWRDFLAQKLRAFADSHGEPFAMRFESRLDFENAIMNLQDEISRWRRANKQGFGYSYYWFAEARVILVCNYRSN